MEVVGRQGFKLLVTELKGSVMEVVGRQGFKLLVTELKESVMEGGREAGIYSVSYRIKGVSNGRW